MHYIKELVLIFYNFCWEDVEHFLMHVIKKKKEKKS